ncbi:type II toxin-antitoxin system RelB/DinJ family antitoxin [Campylobacter sp. faydin G-140]|uniref:type II toxin-antitoxin system RelB/DinJ family antitoxin n=1 Tax=Campylobacter anatolicus TaxID=2829105 RepID=UPI001B99C678|nr:type II toxin-antitoxin system RelB/DinJ family antitoxin [Campylobacter anatolicus]MBR8466498.1 type II toxin-antitoxin system RelB/DinJ family antitoxin [Campylobacter anatolicus]
MTTINIRVSETDKKAVENIFAELGLNLTSATNAFYKQVIRNGGIPFELRTDPFYSEKNLKRLRKSMAQMERNGGTIHEVI